MARPRLVPLLGTVACLLTSAAQHLYGQQGLGEVQVTVQDTMRLPLPAQITLQGDATQWRLVLATDAQGRSAIRAVPFGPYLLRVERSGFAVSEQRVDVRSEVPLAVTVQLAISPRSQQVEVRGFGTLLDEERTGPAQVIGRNTLTTQRAVPASRALLDVVQSQPGWLLEANGVLHPRGSEYQTQYVIDGVPIQDNRSPSFAPALMVPEFQSLIVSTGNYPAEFGRKLGGVVEVNTVRDTRQGWHGQAQAQGGAFSQAGGYASLQWLRGPISIGGSVDAAQTDRFLDPPTEDNFTNRGTLRGASVWLDSDIRQRHRLRVRAHRRNTRFLVPNDGEQEESGQRQDRTGEETLAQISYQHVLSERLLLRMHAMGREVDAQLWSNPFATPIQAGQDRGFREGLLKGVFSYDRGAHRLQWGGEWIGTSLRERFDYRITDDDEFDDELPRQFLFNERKRGHDAAVFAQDTWRMGALTLNAGLRWDRYQLLLTDTAWSPRFGAAYALPRWGLVLRASYDRAFETPAIENLLLASSPATQRLTDESQGLAVPPSRGDFWQAGFSKSLGSKLRLDATYYRRHIRNYADDDPLLNTGVSFPVSFDSAEIHGVEARLELPRWGRFSGYLSYANLTGVGHLPITGGLFLEEDEAELIRATGRFAITQDQRNTASARLRFDAHSRLWFSLGAWYGSGLPVEQEGDEDNLELDEVSPRVLQRVNLDRGRVRPSHSVDIGAGLLLRRGEQGETWLQADSMNLGNRLKVINFTGLLSGTAIAPPRAWAVRLRHTF